MNPTILSPGAICNGVFRAFNPDRRFVGSYKSWFVAKLVSFATILASPDIGQTPVGEVGLESGPSCYMFCDGSEDSVRFQDPAAATLSRQIAPSDSNVGSARLITARRKHGWPSFSKPSLSRTHRGSILPRDAEGDSHQARARGRDSLRPLGDRTLSEEFTTQYTEL